MKKVLILLAVFAMLGCNQNRDEGPKDAKQSAAPVIPAQKTTSGARWELTKSKDEMTDEPRSTALLLGKNHRDENTLIVRCAGKKLEAFATFGEYLGNDSRPVQYRFEQQPPQKETWLISAKGNAVFALESADFARQLMAYNKLIIEVYDFRDVAHRAIFEWSDGAKDIADVLKSCNRSIESLQSKVPGLRKSVALEVERWGPKNIVTKKQTLSAVAGFSGDINDQITPEFALAVQSFADEYMAKCKLGKVKGDHCETIKIVSKINGEETNLSIGSILYDVAPKSIKNEMGKLRIFD